MENYLKILVLVSIGFFMNPMFSHACAKNIESKENACCSSKKHLNTHKKACSEKDSQKKSCDGSCNSSNCNFSPVFSSIFISFIYSIPQNSELICSKKSNFFYLEKNTSLNYFAIWSPPKIG